MKRCECGCGNVVSKPGNKYIWNHVNKGRVLSEEHKRKISLAMKNRQFSEEHKRKLRNREVSNELRKRISQTLQGHIVSKNVRNKIRETLRKKWQNLEYREKQLRAIFAGCDAKPTRPERRLRNRLNNLFPDDYKYVGDGSFLIGFKNPDFINVNGQKKIIEMFGDYWHSKEVGGRTKRQEESQRINHFARYGYKTLIVWERELKNIRRLRKKLVKFHKE